MNESPTFRLKINCGTVAFGEQPELHLADILRGISNTLQHIGTEYKDKKHIRTPIFDVNGIQCGSWDLK